MKPRRWPITDRLGRVTWRRCPRGKVAAMDRHGRTIFVSAKGGR